MSLFGGPEGPPDVWAQNGITFAWWAFSYSPQLIFFMASIISTSIVLLLLQRNKWHSWKGSFHSRRTSGGRWITARSQIQKHQTHRFVSLSKNYLTVTILNITACKNWRYNNISSVYRKKTQLVNWWATSLKRLQRRIQMMISENSSENEKFIL